MFIPIENRKIYELTIEQFKKMIRNGELSKGDKLPSERNLAEQLNVSRASVREALKALEIIGLVESRHGEGNFISESFENCLLEPLSVMFLLNDSKPEDILDLRKLFEVTLASQAAERATPQEIEELGDLVKQFKTFANNEQKSAIIDKQFHYKIAAVSKNYLIMSIFYSISTIIEQFIKVVRVKLLSSTISRENLLQIHEDMFLAIAAKNPEKAALAMQEHMKIITHEILTMMEMQKEQI